MSQHAVLSPSGASKWMLCPGAPAMERGIPDTANEYSDEGTAAHLLGSTCLETGNNAIGYYGYKIIVGSTDDFDGGVWEIPKDSKIFTIRRTYVIDDEMIGHVQTYVDAVREYTKGGLMFAEQRISISAFTGEEGAAGTADAVGVLPRELQVHDLKYGMGVRVYAERNKQLMMYAMGVREEMDLAYGPFDKIRLVIHQPRLDHLSEWDCTAAELDAFGEEVREASGHALAVFLERPEDVAQHLHPSEDACRWCKAKATCPALAKFVTDAAGADFQETTNAFGTFPQDPPPDGPAELAKKLAAVPLIEDWCKAIRAKVESELFAGVAIPGWKIVQGKRGNRSWIDEEKADALLKQMRLKIEERCNLKLKSPTQIEKVLKATPKRLKRLLDANLVGQKDGQPSVAPEADPRPVWTPPDTANDFSAVPQEESLV